MAAIDDFRLTVQAKIEQQRNYFASGDTRKIELRIEKLKCLASSIEKYEDDILQALQKDLNKSTQEGYLTEVSVVLSEIKYHIACLKKWAKPKKVSTPFYLFPSKSYEYCLI